MPIVPEFLDKKIMLHVTPKSPSSMYVGMPIQKAFKFSLNHFKIKALCQNSEKKNVFQKMGISPQKPSHHAGAGQLGERAFWTRNDSDCLDSKFSEQDSFGDRCGKFYQRIAEKVLKFKGEIQRSFKVEMSLANHLKMMLFLQQKWEFSEVLQKKVKTMDEEKNFLQNENNNIQKERKNLSRKNKELVFENTRLKTQNELLLEEKNYFMNHKNCLDQLEPLGEGLSLGNKSASINIGKTKANLSVIEILTDRNKVRLTRPCSRPTTTRSS